MIEMSHTEEDLKEAGLFAGEDDRQPANDVSEKCHTALEILQNELMNCERDISLEKSFREQNEKKFECFGESKDTSSEVTADNVSNKRFVGIDKNVVSSVNDIFSSDHYCELIENITLISNQCNGIEEDNVQKIIFEYAELNKMNHDFDKTSRRTGNEWYQRFIRSYPQLHSVIKKPRNDTIQFGGTDTERTNQIIDKFLSGYKKSKENTTTNDKSMMLEDSNDFLSVKNSSSAEAVFRNNADVTTDSKQTYSNNLAENESFSLIATPESVENSGNKELFDTISSVCSNNSRLVEDCYGGDQNISNVSDSKLNGRLENVAEMKNEENYGASVDETNTSIQEVSLCLETSDIESSEKSTGSETKLRKDDTTTVADCSESSDHKNPSEENATFSKKSPRPTNIETSDLKDDITETVESTDGNSCFVKDDLKVSDPQNDNMQSNSIHPSVNIDTVTCEKSGGETSPSVQFPLKRKGTDSTGPECEEDAKKPKIFKKKGPASKKKAKKSKYLYKLKSYSGSVLYFTSSTSVSFIKPIIKLTKLDESSYKNFDDVITSLPNDDVPLETNHTDRNEMLNADDNSKHQIESETNVVSNDELKSQVKGDTNLSAEVKLKDQGESETNFCADVESKDQVDSETNSCPNVQMKGRVETETNFCADGQVKEQDETETNFSADVQVKEQDETETNFSADVQMKDRDETETDPCADVQLEDKAQTETNSCADIESKKQIEAGTNSCADFQLKDEVEAEMNPCADVESNDQIETEVNSCADAKLKNLIETEINSCTPCADVVLKDEVEAERNASADADLKEQVEAEAEAEADPSTDVDFKDHIEMVETRSNLDKKLKDQDEAKLNLSFNNPSEERIKAESHSSFCNESKDPGEAKTNSCPGDESKDKVADDTNFNAVDDSKEQIAISTEITTEKNINGRTNNEGTAPRSKLNTSNEKITPIFSMQTRRKRLKFLPDGTLVTPNQHYHYSKEFTSSPRSESKSAKKRSIKTSPQDTPKSEKKMKIASTPPPVTSKQSNRPTASVKKEPKNRPDRYIPKPNGQSKKPQKIFDYDSYYRENFRQTEVKLSQSCKKQMVALSRVTSISPGAQSGGQITVNPSQLLSCLLGMPITPDQIRTVRFKPPGKQLKLNKQGNITPSKSATNDPIKSVAKRHSEILQKTPFSAVPKTETGVVKSAGNTKTYLNT